MLAQERQTIILDMLSRQRIIKTLEIAEAFGVSNLTARRDLDALREQGYVRRVHGGAILIPDSVINPVSEVIQGKKYAPKKSDEAIGKLAASMVEEGDVVFLGNGVVTFEIATYPKPDIYHRLNGYRQPASFFRQQTLCSGRAG